MPTFAMDFAEATSIKEAKVGDARCWFAQELEYFDI
jgi:hypothetical protein